MGGLFSKRKGADVFVDFENCKPSDPEQQLHSRFSELLRHGDHVLRLLEEYKGCQELGKRAMSSPTPQNELEAFEGLLLAVDSIAQFYQFSKELERQIPDLFMALARGADQENKASFQSQQALVRQLGEIFNFSLRFDQTRMMRPILSNDFSYYRRLLPKFARHPGIRMKDDDASQIALFTADHIPMTNALVRAVNKMIDRGQNVYVTGALALMANSCYSMVKSKKFSSTDLNLFCVRAMTGSIVLFDHTDTLGAFHKKCPIMLKQCVQLLKKEFSKEGGLLNAIHYSTKHFRDADQSIQALFD